MGKSQEGVEERGAGVVSGLIMEDNELAGCSADKLLATGGKEGR